MKQYTYREAIKLSYDRIVLGVDNWDECIAAMDQQPGYHWTSEFWNGKYLVNGVIYTKQGDVYMDMTPEHEEEEFFLESIDLFFENLYERFVRGREEVFVILFAVGICGSMGDWLLPTYVLWGKIWGMLLFAGFYLAFPYQKEDDKRLEMIRDLSLFTTLFMVLIRCGIGTLESIRLLL